MWCYNLHDKLRCNRFSCRVLSSCQSLQHTLHCKFQTRWALLRSGKARRGDALQDALHEPTWRTFPRCGKLRGLIQCFAFFIETPSIKINMNSNDTSLSCSEYSLRHMFYPQLWSVGVLKTEGKEAWREGGGGYRESPFWVSSQNQRKVWTYE